MSDHDEAVEMLNVAARDVRGLEAMLDAEVFADELFGFMAQQAVEKCLKAWLCEIGEIYPRTHSIAELVTLLADRGQDVGELIDFDDFTPFAGALRYARCELGGIVEDRPDVIQRVEVVFAQVRQRILPEGALEG
jgi:HEPN domain-containing protein